MSHAAGTDIERDRRAGQEGEEGDGVYVGVFAAWNCRVHIDGGDRAVDCTDASARSPSLVLIFPIFMQPEVVRTRRAAEQARTDSEAQLPISEEEIKLAEIIAHSPTATQANQQPQQNQGWFARLCFCFAPIQRTSRRGRRKGGMLLPPQTEGQLGKATLVLDLDETLVHSSFQPGIHADFVFDLEIEGHTHIVSVVTRPGVHEFLQKASELYEVVIFTASMSLYADRVIDVLDRENVVSARLFRESCTYVDGVYVKNLELLGRDLKRVVIVDVSTMQNSPTSYMFQPNNAIPVESWYDDRNDTALMELLEDLQALAFEPDFTVSLPPLVQDRQNRIDIRRIQEQEIQDDAPPIAKQLPPSPPTHAGDHGSYNSPRGMKDASTWPKAVVS